ncbi:MAG: hypothetical protein DYG86_15740 [Chloroflexi bacterium CFX2]|nr:hypothetical protein [Chloroflexi bacterium CFX2]
MQVTGLAFDLQLATFIFMISPRVKNTLALGDYELRGQFMLGSNYTFLVDVHHEGEIIKAVYKPSKGEQPLWDFPDNTLALREVAAYELSEALGFHIVPVTVYRDDGPHGPGSLQQYLDYDIEYHYFNFTPEDKHKLRPVVLFDLLANNADRKGSHVFFEEETRHLYAIDHGICFHEELSSTQSWSGVLESYLSPKEIRALIRRADELCKTKVFPRPAQGRRMYPYPPI